VRERVIESNRQRLEVYFRDFVKHSEANVYWGQLRGRLFEDLAHKMLQRGGTFSIRALSSMTRPPSKLHLTQSKLTDLRSVTDIKNYLSTEEPRYLKPVASNFGAVDALSICENRAIYLFQMMTGR
jgi:hypothetical protein